MPPRQRKTKAQLVEELEALRARLVELEAIRKREEKYHLLLEESSDPIFTLNKDGGYRYFNRAFAEGVGKDPEDIVGKKIWDFLSKDEAEKKFAEIHWVFEHAETRVIEAHISRPDGDRYYLTTAKPILDEQGRVSAVICTAKDITERKQGEQELQYLSTHDILTGLFNRNFFEVELARMQLSRSFPLSIVVADIDDLKTANDHYGHTTGDGLIRKTAEVLRQSFRAGDITARIGGDEFAVLLPETDEPNAQAAVGRLRENIVRQGDPLLNLSIGFAVGEEGSSLVEVLRQADDCMYLDKIQRKKKVD
jgi:diguanylate cyclase (GGDEF)-like protein/PAS domain S-box-containing protein